MVSYFHIAHVRVDPSFTNYNNLSVLAMKMVENGRHTTFLLVYCFIEMVLILLVVAIASVERAFTAMKFIKTDLGNKTEDEWLNDRMICYIE